MDALLHELADIGEKGFRRYLEKAYFPKLDLSFWVLVRRGQDSDLVSKSPCMFQRDFSL